METINFGKATKDILKLKLGLKQINKSEDLDLWFRKSKEIEITDIEYFVVEKLQNMMIRRVHEWNEFELSEHFIGPIMAMVDFNTDYFSMFAERTLEIETEKYFLTGKADLLVASGETDPILPYLCVQEYKRQTDPNGDPLYQVVCEMFVAAQKNNNTLPIYGISILGVKWNFIILKNNEYCVSYSFSADSVQIFEIFKIIKALKEILLENTKN